MFCVISGFHNGVDDRSRLLWHGAMYIGKQLRNVSEEIVAHNLKGVYIDSSWITMKIGAKNASEKSWLFTNWQGVIYH